MGCVQNFNKIIQTLYKTKGDSPLSFFKDINVNDEYIKALSDYIYDKIEPSSIVLDYNSLIQSLSNLSSLVSKETKELLYPGLTENVREDIINYIKYKHYETSDSYSTNPRVNTESGKKELIDVSDISKLLGNDKSTENYLYSELEKAVYAVVFINADNRGKNGFNNFVVTDLALDHNIKVYKNDLWDYIVKASGLTSQFILDNALYIKQEIGDDSFEYVINKDLFIPDENGESTYLKVIKAVKSKFDQLEIYSTSTKGTSTTSAFIATLLLTNFDNLISNKHSDIISVNPEGNGTFGQPSDSQFKYTSKIKTASVETWDSSSAAASDIDNFSSSLVKIVTNNIPFVRFVEEGEEKETVNNAKILFNNRQALGKSGFDSIGAIINSLPQTFKINITVNGNNKVITVHEAFEYYDKNQISFENILKAIFKNRYLDKDLTMNIHALNSIINFLYKSDSGITRLLNKWKLDVVNKDDVDKTIDIEQVIINAIRNTTKVKYRFEAYDKLGRTVDAMSLDSKTADDFASLLLNLATNRKKKLTDSTIFNDVDLSTYGGVFDFIEKYGEITLSKTARNKFLKTIVRNKGQELTESSPINKTLQNNLKKYLLTDNKESFEDENGTTALIDISDDTLISKLKDQSLFKEFDLQTLFTSKHREEKNNTVTQIKTFSGDSLPTISIANPASLYNTSLAKAKEDTFFKQNPKLFLGVTILTEIEGKDEAKSVDELNHVEAFKLGFTRNFIMSGINSGMQGEGRFLIQPWNFSDKTKIFTLEIDSNSPLKGLGEISKISIEDLQQELRVRQSNFYDSMINRMYDDYTALGFFRNAKDSKTKIQQIETFLEGKSLSELEGILREHNEKPGNKNIELVRDLHYSEYGKSLKFNQLIKTNQLIFSNNTLFKEWVKSQEDSLQKYLEGNIRINSKELKIKSSGKYFYSNPTKIASELGTYYGLTSIGTKDFPEYDIFDYDADTKQSYLKLSNEKGLSEIVKKYLWTKNLVLTQYENLTTKGAYIHPFKDPDKKPFKEINTNDKSEETGWIKDWIKEEKIRTTAFTKRMVIGGASMTIFNKGPQGIDQEIKIAVFNDPTESVFDFTGKKDKQKTMDGGIPVNPFFVAQTISAIPGLGLTNVQKPIGTSIKDGHSTFIKCATFGMTNELIRNSMKSEFNLRTWMKKMNNFDIYEDTDHNNLFSINDNDINLNADANGLYIPINGEFVEFSNITKVDDDNKNTYILSYKKGGEILTKNIKINNLFDLWEAFGGGFSAKKVMKEINGKSIEKFVYTETSIDLVNSIIKKHAVSNTLKLKDKMITMFLPETAVKNGATNINSTNILHKDNTNKPLWFTFDTSFFGIQLDASHISDESTVSEITQVISAASENNAAPELFNDLYDAISNIIEASLKDFDDIPEDSKLKNLTEIFVNNLKNSSQINNSKIIIDNLYEATRNTFNPTKSEDSIPYSNKTIYKQFVSTIISKINSDYVKRKFPGAAMVLNPSQGMMKVYESNSGKIYIVEDVFDKYKTLIIPQNGVLTEKQQLLINSMNEINNSQISEYKKIEARVELVLNNSEEFSPKENVSLNEVKPLDFITLIFDKLKKPIIINNKTIKSGELIKLTDISDYYEFKRQLKSLSEPVIINKIFTETRDLKPVDITYEIQKGVDEETSHIRDLLNTKLNDLAWSVNTLNFLNNNDIKTLGELSQHNLDSLSQFKLFNNKVKSEIEEKLKDLNLSFNTDITKYEIKNEYRNIFDLDAIEFKWEFEENSKDPKTIIKINNFINYLKTANSDFAKIYNSPISKTLKDKLVGKYIQRYIQRSMSLLESGKAFKSYNDYTSENPFFDMFRSISENGEVKYDSFEYGFDNTIKYDTNFIQNYKHNDAENIISKVHKSEFDLGEFRHAEITPQFFVNNLRTFINVPKKLEHDVYLVDTKTGDRLSVLINVNGNRYKVENDYLTQNKPNGKIIGKDFFIHVESENKVDKSGKEITKTYRKNTSGKNMYEIPETGKFFKDKFNNEILLLDNINDLSSFIKGSKGKFNLIDVNDFHRAHQNLFVKEENGIISSDSLISIYDTLIDNINDFNSKRFLKSKKKSYLINKTLAQESEKTFNESGEKNNYINTVYSKQLVESVNRDNYLKAIANSLFNSWTMSNYSLSARIPAQAYQSFMSMKTVGYTQDNSNNAYVSHWQLWLQGSDFDIDKVYMMMYGFRNGVFEKWSPFFNVSSQKSLELSLQLPLPNRKEYLAVDAESNAENTLDLSNDMDLSSKDDNVKLARRVFVLNMLKANPDIKYINADPRIIKSINKHNAYRNDNGIKNFIVNTLIKLNRNPKNQIAAYSPISFGDYTEIGKKIEGAYDLSNTDGYSTYLQQEQNSVGKKVIGIAATGLKDYFSLITYFSNYYNGKITPDDNEFFMRSFNILGKEYIIKKIGGLNLKETASKLLEKAILDQLSTGKYLKKNGKEFKPEELVELSKLLSENDPALSISALLSLATDNAKELMLAKINAGVDFASMHIYLLILGLDETTIGTFMTSDYALTIKKQLTQDFFVNGNEKSVDSMLKSIKNKTSEKTDSDDDKKSVSEFNDYLNEFRKIYTYSKELTSLGGLLSVNQGLKASEEDIYNISRKINSIVVSQQNQFFDKTLNKEIKKSKTEDNNILKQLTDYIQKDKPYLTWSYITKTLQEAISYDILYKGINMDMYYSSMDSPKIEGKSRYVDIVTNYYNLIKHTFNVLDVVNKIPHFNSMLKSFYKGEKSMRTDLNKYGFKTDTVPFLIEIGKTKEELNSKKINKSTRTFSNPENSVVLDLGTLETSGNAIDNIVTLDWLKSMNINLDLNQIMSWLNKDRISILVNDKNSITTEEIGKTLNSEKEVYTVPENKVNVPLHNEFGLAQFKYLMENEIIPELKRRWKSNKFMSEYTIGKQKVYNMNKTIKFYDDISNNELFSAVQKGLNKLATTNDDSYSLPIKSILVSDNSDISNFENIRALDLLFLYNHLVNEGRFGGNRATIFFSQDIGNLNSFSRKLAEFQREKDLDRTYLSKIKEKIENDKAFRHVLYMDLFGKREREGRTLITVDEVFGDTGHDATIFPINNRYYTLLESLEDVEYNGSQSANSSDLAKEVINKLSNRLLELKCE